MDNGSATVVLDGFPVAEGHSLVIPKRHVELLFDLPESELLRVWALVAKVRQAPCQLLAAVQAGRHVRIG